MLMTQYWIMLILFSVALRDDNIQEFVMTWDEVPQSVTQISSDEIMGKPVQIEDTRV